MISSHYQWVGIVSLITTFSDSESKRKATVRFSYTDGWGEVVMAELGVTQDMYQSHQMNITSFAQLRQRSVGEITRNRSCRCRG